MRLMDFNMLLWFLIGAFTFLWVLMGPYILFCLLLDSNGSLWVFIRPYSSF